MIGSGTARTVTMGVLLLVAPAGAQAPAVATLDRADVVSVGAIDVSAEVARQVALHWDVAPERVRVDFADDVPGRTDSLMATEGSTDRWIVTLWAEGRPSRRFVRVGVAHSVPVATRVLSRGDPIDSTDVRYEDRAVWGRPGDPLPDPIGMVAERRVPEGDVLMAPSVRPPFLMRGGDTVDAVYTQSGVILRIRAEALASARLGDRLDVRLASGLRMSGRAVAPGVVELTSGDS
jgi:flagella basal body P-ring formation protein FlgA